MTNSHLFVTGADIGLLQADIHDSELGAYTTVCYHIRMSMIAYLTPEEARKRKLARAKRWAFMNKEHVALYAKERRLKNLENIRVVKKAWNERNREKMRLWYRENYRKNRERIIANKKARIAANPELYAKRRKERRAKDDNFRLADCLRAGVRRVLGKRQAGGSAVRDLGCSIDELRIHIERQFNKGMTWENYGFRGWHIDHIQPLTSFDLTDRNEFLKACHYTNLQPLWWRENLSKSNKLLT